MEVTRTVVNHTNSDKLIAGLKKSQVHPKSVQEMMANARRQVDLLSEQVQRL
jgi:hypothetical protein